MCYLNGTGVAPDNGIAKGFFETAINSTYDPLRILKYPNEYYATAYFGMGIYYQQIGSSQTRHYYTTAAHFGNSKAQYIMALWDHHDGFLQLSATQNYAPALYSLALKKMTNSTSNALTLLRDAATQHYQPAIDQLRKHAEVTAMPVREIQHATTTSSSSSSSSCKAGSSNPIYDTTYRAAYDGLIAGGIQPGNAAVVAANTAAAAIAAATAAAEAKGNPATVAALYADQPARAAAAVDAHGLLGKQTGKRRVETDDVAAAAAANNADATSSNKRARHT